jgi:hypothetical protein
MLWRQRDERAWHLWQQLRSGEGVGRTPGRWTLLQVRSHRQRARTGLKAYVSFEPSTELYAAWFPGDWPAVGTHLLVWGHIWDDLPRTHHSEAVFWIDSVSLRADGRVPAYWQRHQRRRVRAGVTYEPAGALRESRFLFAAMVRLARGVAERRGLGGNLHR